MPAIKEEVDVVCGGGAGHIVTIAGALQELDRVVDIRRAGGSSAGAICPAALAFGISADDQFRLLQKIMTGNRLKDRSWNPFDRYGIYKGDALYEALISVFGNKKMGEAFIPLRIVVCDMWTRKPVIIDSENPKHADLLVVDVLRASASIPFFFKTCRLEKLFGSRHMVDGGTAANFAMNMFDDNSRKTIGLRLEPGDVDEVFPIRNISDFIEGLASLLMWASDNAHISNKHYANVVSLPKIGNGLDFNLSAKVIEDRWIAGKKVIRDAEAEGRFKPTPQEENEPGDICQEDSHGAVV